MTDKGTRYDDFDCLMLRHQRLIRAMCWWHASGDATVCADLIQEVLLTLWRRRNRLRPDANEFQERAWVRLQCRSVFSHIDRRLRPTLVPLDDAIHLASDESDLRSELEDMAAGLTEGEHHVLQRILDGYSIAEIAEELDIKPASVSQTRYRIIQKMRKEL
ncbi:MAG: sigma-70 family RNA polymerase sigma factor [Bacteroidales bacterium]|nr:sigma-70 family RNA polymerase sigma factor [Bacteroidales bacterium]